MKIFDPEYGRDNDGSFVNFPGREKYRPLENKDGNKRVRKFIAPDKKHAVFVKRNLPYNGGQNRSILNQDEVDIWNENHPGHPAKLCNFNNEPIIIMEQIDGDDGIAILNKNITDPIQILKILLAAAKAIQEFNKKFAHHDARWENLIFNEQGKQLEAKFIDFGRAEKKGANNQVKCDIFLFFGEQLDRIKRFFPQHAQLKIFHPDVKNYTIEKVIAAIEDDLKLLENQPAAVQKPPEEKNPAPASNLLIRNSLEINNLFIIQEFKQFFSSMLPSKLNFLNSSFLSESHSDLSTEEFPFHQPELDFDSSIFFQCLKLIFPTVKAESFNPGLFYHLNPVTRMMPALVCSLSIDALKNKNWVDSQKFDWSCNP